MRRLRVGVIMGGQSAEREVSLASGQNIISNLDKKKYVTVPIEITARGEWVLPVSLLRPGGGSKAKESVPSEDLQVPTIFPIMVDGRLVGMSLSELIDVAFIALHGPLGEDGTVQGVLELAGIPYTGSRLLASALGMNKLLSKKIFLHQGLPVAPFLSVEAIQWKQDSRSLIQKTQNLGFPVVVKPVAQGSSIGVTIVKQKEELDHALELAFNYDPIAIVEKYLRGKEIQVGIIGNRDLLPLPPIEIVSKKEFFDYEAKYDSTKAEEIVPARISQAETRLLQDLAVRAYQALGCRGFARIDMFLCRGRPFVSEVNTIPGLTSGSLFPKEARAAGMEFPELLDRLIQLALER
ncbi:D-alanine-D-alanine ligase [Candidatus Hakubella thermalkaliphila]|nr:D-alanine-D-alanine ligase [Candidatus Hakubella thermalkaliphila]